MGYLSKISVPLASTLLAALGGCQRRKRISVVASIEMKRRPSNGCRTCNGKRV